MLTEEQPRFEASADDIKHDEVIAELCPKPFALLLYRTMISRESIAIILSYAIPYESCI